MDILAVGMTVADLVLYPVDQTPEPGELQAVPSQRWATGGPGCTFARDCAMLGWRTGLASTVGLDWVGTWIIEELAPHLDVSRIVRVSEGTTLSVVLVDKTGERRFLFVPGATAAALVADLPTAPSDVKLLHVGGVPRLGAWDGKPLRALLKQAHEHGTLTSLDTVGATSGWGQAREILPEVDWAFPSYDEAVRLTGLNDAESQLAWLLDHGPKVAAIKLGNQGALVGSVDGNVLRATPPAVSTRDTTGAGEAFCAGLVTALLERLSLEDAARFATACGTLATQSVGGPLQVTQRQDVREWEAAHPVTITRVH